MPPSWVKDATYFITVCCRQRGANLLCLPDVAERLFEAGRYYHERGQWHVHLWLLMPDHAHALLACPREQELAKIVGAWKRHTARNLGIAWQRGFFDHRLRSDESFDEKAAYIRMNPVRRGLVGRPEEWGYVWPR